MNHGGSDASSSLALNYVFAYNFSFWVTLRDKKTGLKNIGFIKKI